MGQKVNPYGFRLGITTDWKSRWFEERNYQNCVIEDWKIRDYLMSQLESAAVSRIEVERTRDRLRVDIHTARPASSSAAAVPEADRLKKKIEEITGLNNRIQLNIQEIKQPELDAALVAQGIGEIERAFFNPEVLFDEAEHAAEIMAFVIDIAGRRVGRHENQRDAEPKLVIAPGCARNVGAS